MKKYFKGPGLFSQRGKKLEFGAGKQYIYLLGFPGGSDGQESACHMGDLCLTPGLASSPGGGPGNPLQYSCLENSHGQRSLVGYSPWDRKESDMTE